MHNPINRDVPEPDRENWNPEFETRTGFSNPERKKLKPKLDWEEWNPDRLQLPGPEKK